MLCIQEGDIVLYTVPRGTKYWHFGRVTEVVGRFIKVRGVDGCLTTVYRDHCTVIHSPTPQATA